MALFCACCTINILLKLVSHFSNRYWFLHWKVLTCVRTPQRQFLIFFSRLSKQVFLILGLRRVNPSISSHQIRETTLIFQTNWFFSFPYVCFNRKCFLVFGTAENKVKRNGFCNKWKTSPTLWKTISPLKSSWKCFLEMLSTQQITNKFHMKKTLLK